MIFFILYGKKVMILYDLYDVMIISNGIFYILFLKMIDKNRFGLDFRNLGVKCNYERYLFFDN